MRPRSGERQGRFFYGWVIVACNLLISVVIFGIIYSFGVLYGIACGGIDPPVVALIGDPFGMRRVGVIMGSLPAGWCAGAALGPYIAGYIFDVSSSYSAAFVTGSAFIAIAALAI